MRRVWIGAPYVTQAKATTLVVDHIEKYWCPSFTSADLLE